MTPTFPPDFLDLAIELNRADARYLPGRRHAVAVHGRPRPRRTSTCGSRPPRPSNARRGPRSRADRVACESEPLSSASRPLATPPTAIHRLPKALETLPTATCRPQDALETPPTAISSPTQGARDATNRDSSPTGRARDATNRDSSPTPRRSRRYQPRFVAHRTRSRRHQPRFMAHRRGWQRVEASAVGDGRGPVDDIRRGLRDRARPLPDRTRRAATGPHGVDPN